MPLSVRKVYRAFPELEHLSDEECRRYVRKVRADGGYIAFVYPVVGVLAAAAWLTLLIWTVGRAGYLGRLSLDDPQPLMVVSALAVGGSVLFGSVAGLICRDQLLLRRIKRELCRARCTRCKHPLLGLPIRYTGLGPPEPGEARVRCPECGKEIILLEAGLTPRDLIPFEHRETPTDMAHLRRDTRWTRTSDS